MPLQQGTGSTPIKVENSENHVIPDAIRFDPAKSLENKPKGNFLIIFQEWGRWVWTGCMMFVFTSFLLQEKKK